MRRLLGNGSALCGSIESLVAIILENKKSHAGERHGQESSLPSPVLAGSGSKGLRLQFTNRSQRELPRGTVNWGWTLSHYGSPANAHGKSPGRGVNSICTDWKSTRLN